MMNMLLYQVGRTHLQRGQGRRLLGYETRMSLRDGLASMVEWIERRGPRDFVYDRDLEIATASTPRAWVDKLI